MGYKKIKKQTQPTKKMKTIIYVTIFCVLTSQVFTEEPTNDQTEEDLDAIIDEAHKKWTEEYAPVGRNNNSLMLLKSSSASDDQKKKTFADNYKLIDAHNKSDSTFKMKLNQFAELTQAEFESLYLTNYDEKDFKGEV